MQRDIVIGIPTFRRPELLRILLDSLEAELAVQPAFVVVADNDCGVEASAVVDAFKSRWSDIVCIPVPERGVAQVRNALVAAAGRFRPDWTWLLMLDDDGRVEPGWMQTILSCGETYQANLVGGPVEGVLPEDAGLLVRNSVFASRRRWPTGPVGTLNTTQNLAISRRTLDLLAPPLFRNQYGATGGEDYDLFRQVAAAGGRLVWCDEAVVTEPAPADRLEYWSLLGRYYSTGAYMARIDRHYDGTLAAWRASVAGLVSLLLRSVAMTVLSRRNDAARAFLSLVHYAGRIHGLLGGARLARYVKPT
ncbi:MAG: glycosyltransferase [Bradyrhizobiaceae bacterium]|jgi:glycosyltransferase involved in cell wall biosynthesis|nr:MAG: glycosyltransferase [Bradyrhizobiaceae bacterium]